MFRNICIRSFDCHFVKNNNLSLFDIFLIELCELVNSVELLIKLSLSHVTPVVVIFVVSLIVPNLFLFFYLSEGQSHFSVVAAC